MVMSITALAAGCQANMNKSSAVSGTTSVTSGASAMGGTIEYASFAESKDGLRDVSEVAYYSSDEALAAGKNYFRQEHYGNAERAFRKAVELLPTDGEAWLGLAASYDRIRRFDLADRAYRRAHQILGGTYEYYNNVGYSYLLRGDLRRARSNFLKAYELQPSNVVVANNIELLSSSIDSPQR